MPTYVSLLSYTQEGILNIKEAPARMEAARQAGKALGVELKQWFLVMGQYDIVAVLDAPNDEAITKVALLVGMQGRTRSETLRAFTEDEFRQMAATLP